jgi:hypothetical protein
MSMSRTSTVRSPLDHFEPEETTDPQAQRRLRGQLEQIDYTAFAANKAAIAQTIKQVDAGRFQRLAIAVAQARAQWVSAALTIAETGREPAAAEIERLARLRTAWNELSEAYEGLRRMVGRGYVTYEPGANQAG